MRRNTVGLFGLCSAAAVLALSAGTAGATFHLMQIEQVLAGVNGDTSAQAIQLRMRAFGQHFVSEARLVAWDAAGENPIVILDIPTNVQIGNLGSRVLIVSQDFPGFTDPETKPDFVLEHLIPESYLAAGRLTFESNDGNEIVWSLAWGGDEYTGPHDGSIFNDADGFYGPAWPGPLPTDGRGLLFQGNANALSTSNEDDYELTDGPAVVTNNAADSFTVVIDDEECYADFDGNGVLNLFDFLAYTNAFNDSDPSADCDDNGVLNLFDFLCFTNAFNAGC